MIIRHIFLSVRIVRFSKIFQSKLHLKKSNHVFPLHPYEVMVFRWRADLVPESYSM